MCLLTVVVTALHIGAILAIGPKTARLLAAMWHVCVFSTLPRTVPKSIGTKRCCPSLSRRAMGCPRNRVNSNVFFRGNLVAARLASSSCAPPRVVGARSACRRLARRGVAPARSAPERLESQKSAPMRSVALRLVTKAIQFLNCPPMPPPQPPHRRPRRAAREGVGA